MMFKGFLEKLRRKPLALTGALGLAVLTWPAVAAEEDPATPQKHKEVPLLERMVPIPSHSPPVEDNGCPVRSNPNEPRMGNYGIPFFDLISDAVGRYSVTITVADRDPRAAFNEAVKQLDPDTRALATLYALWDGLGRDGLHTYFYMRGGSIAHEVRDALKAAGLSKEHEIFASAMALFGPEYPVDEKNREQNFGYARGQGELDTFDLKLMAIAAKFPDRDAFAARIESYATTRPALWQSIEARRKSLGAMRRTEILIQQLWSALPPGTAGVALHEELAKRPAPERNLMAIDAFNDEFENGGIHQFFFNSTGDIAPDVYEAMLALGLTRQAKLMQQAMALFTSPYPTDRALRARSYIGKHDVEGFETELSDMTDAFYAIEGGPEVTHLGGQTQISGGPGIRDAIVRYAQEHKLLPC